jgi:hypothetical protein
VTLTELEDGTTVLRPEEPEEPGPS